MKSFSVNKNPIDIEELNKIKCLNTNNKVCEEKSKTRRTIHLINPNDSSEWFTPLDMDSLYKLLVQYQQLPYKLISGNTGIGIFKNDGPYQV